MNGLDNISIKFPAYDKRVFNTGLNLNTPTIMSKSYCINSFEIITLTAWSTRIKNNTGLIKNLNLLTKIPPSKSNFSFSYTANFGPTWPEVTIPKT